MKKTLKKSLRKTTSNLKQPTAVTTSRVSEQHDPRFLYRHGKQIGLNWDYLRAQHDQRLADQKARNTATKTKPKTLKKKPTAKKVLKRA